MVLVVTYVFESVLGNCGPQFFTATRSRNHFIIFKLHCLLLFTIFPQLVATLYFYFPPLRKVLSFLPSQYLFYLDSGQLFYLFPLLNSC